MDAKWWNYADLPVVAATVYPMLASKKLSFSYFTNITQNVFKNYIHINHKY